MNTAEELKRPVFIYFYIAGLLVALLLTTWASYNWQKAAEDWQAVAELRQARLEECERRQKVLPSINNTVRMEEIMGE